jgi:hypothetical protein
MPMSPKRPLTPDEKKLWRYVTRNDAPLRPENAQEEAEAPPIKKQKSVPAITVKKDVTLRPYRAFRRRKNR